MGPANVIGTTAAFAVVLADSNKEDFDILNILVSNDDGYLAPGINALAQELSSIANIYLVAPDRNRSGASSSLTLTQPINTVRHKDNVFSVEGTPADCINIALGGLIEQRMDMVISGINDGPNMADDALYSGTVAAAIEGRHLGLPSVAVSMASFHPKHFSTAAVITKKIITHLLAIPLAANTILNINVPDLALSEIKGISSTRLGSRLPPEYAAEHANPRAQTMFWLGPAGDENDNAVGTDFHAVKHGFVSVTPLTIDMTNHKVLDAMESWLEQLDIQRI